MNDWSDEQRPHHPWRPSGSPTPDPPEFEAAGNDWADAEQLAVTAHSLYEEGRLCDARDQLEAALTLNPDCHEWWFGLGLICDAMACFEESVRAYRRARRDTEEDVPVLLNLGVSLLQLGEATRAIDAFTEASRLDPDCEAAYCHRILAHAELGDHEQAELCFYLARQLTDDCPVCLDHLAQSLAMRRDFKRAIACWKQVNQLDPGYPDLWLNVARAYRADGKPERADSLYLRQYRMDPGDTDLLVEWADLLAERDRVDEADEKLRRVLELDPNHVAACVRRGELALERNDDTLARSLFEQAREIDASLPGIHLGLAQVYERRGEHSRALRMAMKELDRGGQSPRQVVHLAHLLARRRADDAVLELLGPMLTGEDPTLLDEPECYHAALYCRAVVHLGHNRLSHAITDLRLLKRMKRDDAAVLLALAQAYRLQGRHVHAMALARRALRRHPHHRALRRLKRRLIVARLLRRA